MKLFLLYVFLALTALDWWRGSWRETFLEFRLRGMRGLFQPADPEQRR